MGRTNATTLSKRDELRALKKNRGTAVLGDGSTNSKKQTNRAKHAIVLISQDLSLFQAPQREHSAGVERDQHNPTEPEILNTPEGPPSVEGPFPNSVIGAVETFK